MHSVHGHDYGGVPLVIDTGIVSSGIPGESVLSCQVHIEEKYAMHAYTVCYGHNYSWVCTPCILCFLKERSSTSCIPN